MNSLGERLQKALENKGISRYRLSVGTGISQSTIGRLIKDEGEAHKSTLTTISEFLNISVDWLINGNGEMILSEPSIEYHPFSKSRVQIRQVTSDSYMEVKYLPIIAHAGYLNGYYDNEENENELDYMLVPKEYEKGNYLVVEVSGDSMNDGTTRAICDGDRLLIKELDKSLWKDKLHFRQNLFVIMSNEGIVCKQVTEHNTDTHELRCHSWNENYPDYTISLENVYKLFYVKKIVERRIRF